MDDSSGVDICRVCRSEGLPERPLFHPCICTGSIKWIHQECLVQWMRYSRKEYCELCGHRFSFTPIYSPDMPQRLPLKDVAGGLFCSVAVAVKYWLHYIIVAFAWLGLVPLTACRIYRSLFSGSVESIITLPVDILKTQNISSDVFHGCFVIICSVFAFLGLVLLREQIVHGGGPDWLEPEQELQVPQQQQLDLQPDNDNLQVQEIDIARLPVDLNNYNNSNNNNDSDSNVAHYDSNESEINHDVFDNEVPGTSPIGPDANNHFNNNHSENIDEENDNECENSEILVFGDGAQNSFDYKGAEGSSRGSHHNENLYVENTVSNSCNTFDNNNIGLKNGSNFHNNGSEAIETVNRETGEANFNNHVERDNSFSEAQNENQEAEANNELVEERNQVDEIEADIAIPEAGENAQDDGNWNPIDWDRAVEELTWQRLLGLDGPLILLEHIFSIVSLNALIILVFAFLPYHFGNFAIRGLGLREKTEGAHFEGLITTLCGYCIIGLCLVVLHTIASSLGLQRSKRLLGLCYITVKVSLLAVFEIGVLPLICGWWLDICSLSMFDATLKDRETTFKLAPGTSMFIHWLVGIVYVYYFASFILLLKEVVRPGVLWFLKNLNDPDYSPIQGMIHTPIIHHVRVLLASSVVFGTAALLILWIPVRIIRYLWPTFLPYAVALQIESQMNEFSLELLLLQVILPSLLQQSYTRIWMKNLIRLWCKCTAWIFGIQSYLLGDEEDHNGNVENNQGVFNGLGAVHRQALLPREGPIRVQPYHRPSWFYARLIGLLFSVCISLIIASLAALTLPVWIGRQVMSLWLVCTPNPSAIAAPLSEEVPTRIHDLYTAFCGIYLCWLTARAITLLSSWFPQGRAAISDTDRLMQSCLWGAKCLIAFGFLLGIIPLLFGLLLELVFLVPLRVPLDQTPVLFVWQDWALGVLYTKIAYAMILMGPDWKMRRAVERVYRDGIRNMDLSFILRDLAIPVTTGFSLALAVPYAAAHSIIPLIISNVELKILIARLLYPCLLLAFILSSLVAFQIRQFKKLYEHIKNDKYLVGKRLVNYDHRRNKGSSIL